MYALLALLLVGYNEAALLALLHALLALLPQDYI
jgi:hypothetical protein